MNTTPLAHLTDDEFVSHLSRKDNPTDEEIEAMVRMEYLLNELADLRHTTPVKTKYKEVA